MTFNWKDPNHWILLFTSLFLVVIAAYGIYQAELTPGLQILMLIGALGYLSGFLLSLSNFSRRTAIIFSIVYAGFAIFFIVGTSYAAYQGLSWAERVSDIILDQTEWINKAFTGGTSREPLIFVVQTSVIFWMIGHAAAWSTFRDQRIWRVLLPSGIVLISVVYYYYGPRQLWVYLAMYVLASFVYIALTHLATQEITWRTESVRYAREISYNFLGAGLIVAMASMLVAWQAPTFAPNNSVNNALSGTNPAWIELQDNWTRLFSALRSYSTSTSDSVSNSLSLGGPRNVSNTFIMDIFVSEQLPYAYWHQISYESYNDGQWLAPEGDQTIRVPDEGQFDVPSFGTREVITQTVRNYLPNSGQIYGLPDIVGSDKQMFVTSAPDERGRELVSMVQSRYVLPQGDTYTTQSLVSRATQIELRGDSQRYPDWINPYLETSGSVSDATAALAEELAAPFDNPYDVSIAIQNYLRENITYNDQIDAPPDNVNEIDYILFDLQEAYCNYYATSMVMMLRHLGIPARPSVGFAAGEYIEDANLYRVRARDSHMWVDVYFPGHGWIQFEPTSAIAVPDRPIGNENSAGPSSPIEREDPQFDPGRFDEPFFEEGSLGEIPENINADTQIFDWSSFTSWPALLGMFLIVIAGGGSMATVRINRQAEHDIGRTHEHFGRWGQRLGLEMEESDTPFERADSMSEIIPAGQQSFYRLARQFVQAKFSPTQKTEIGFNPAREWQKIRPLLIREAFSKRYGALFRRFRR